IGMVAIGGTGAFGGTNVGPQGTTNQGTSQQGSSSIFSTSFGVGSSQSQQGQQAGAQPNPAQPSTDPNATASGAAPGTELNADGPPALPPAPQAPKQADAGASSNDSTVFGGQIVGVASKIDRKSIRFYKGYGKYREWEFIWDPAEDAAAASIQPNRVINAP